jgi:hypothetical protein
MPSPTVARPRLRRTRSGTSMPRVDGRLLAARRFRELVEQFEAELGTDLSAADRELVKTAAGLVLRREQMEQAVINGQPVDDDQLVRVASESRRALATLRAKAAKAKPAGPNLHEYLAAKYGAEVQE